MQSQPQDASSVKSHKMSNRKLESTIHTDLDRDNDYTAYLRLDALLGAQQPLSDPPHHDEMLFIIIHQVYELWFKQILYELDSVIDIFGKDDINESHIGTAVSRLNRIIEIQKILIDQIQVLETMSPMDFLDFRDFLIPASGFQIFFSLKIIMN